MKWIISNEKRPDKEGLYYAEDSNGFKCMVRFREGNWMSNSGHPVDKWLDESGLSFTVSDLILVWAKAQEITYDNISYDKEEEYIEQDYSMIEKERNDWFKKQFNIEL